VGDQVLATPKHTAGALLTVTPRAGTTVTAGLAYVGSYRQTDFVALLRCANATGPCPSDFNFAVTYPGFAKLNAAVSQQITPQLDGFLSVDNLTNNDTFEGGNSLPVMGRTSTAGFRFRY
jgi:outer membrane receptor protein involved in Fe transport